MEIQSIYQKTIKFAAEKHEEINQKVPGTNLTYLLHLSNVAMEILVAGKHSLNFDENFAIQLALLHDTLEDTRATFQEIESNFGLKVAEGVSALTKNDKLPKEDKMIDSLNRIKLQPKEVGAVKLADRITNLQTPPQHWSKEKILKYHKEAKIILENLRGCNTYLETRLENKIEEYLNF